MYRVFRQTADGEFVHVTTRHLLEQAVEIAEAFNFQWPGRYAVRDLEGNDVYHTQLRTVQTRPHRLSKREPSGA